MTTKELLIPRWKVIADYPGSTFYVGEVFELPSKYRTQQIVLSGNVEEVDLDIDPNSYPAIFKQLEWWEERDIDDLPKYIKKIDSGAVYKIHWNRYNNQPKCVSIWFNRKGIDVDFNGQDQDFSLLRIYEPATEQEYLSQ